MSATPPQSPSKSLSTVDFLGTSEQLSKDDDNSLVEADPDERLDIGPDLEDRLDYEADELHEQEEILNTGKSFPLNEKENVSQDFDNYEGDAKEQSQSPFNSNNEGDEDHSPETSTLKILDGEVDENNDAKVKYNEADKKLSDVSNQNDRIGNDADTEEELGLEIGTESKLKENDGCEDKPSNDNADKSAITLPDEELEEGEVSDEDEEARKERLKPQPVCRFYSKGACTWGSSCRFIHPGVLDTGR